MKKVMTRLALATLFMFAFVVTANQANAATDAQVKGVHTVEMPATKVTFPDGSVLVKASPEKMQHQTHAGEKMSDKKATTLFSLSGLIGGGVGMVTGLVFGHHHHHHDEQPAQ